MGKGRFTLLLLFVIGLVLLAGSVYSGQQRYALIHAAHEVSGKIVGQRYDNLHVGAKYDRRYPIVQFTLPSGATIKTELTDTSSKTLYVTGSELPVLYLQQPGQPIQVRSGAFLDLWQTTLIMAGVGLAFTLPFVMFLVSSIRVSARTAALQRDGQRINATLSGVVQDNSVMVNGRGAYRIESTWKDTINGLDIKFRSERIWTDPTPHLQGNTVPVYINPNNPGDYIMDLSFLPK